MYVNSSQDTIERRLERGGNKMKQESFKQRYVKLFITFLKIGAFTFGGGYAMIPLIQRETIERHHWIDDQDLLDMLAIAESTPGVIAVNSATFVGYRVAGFWGALFATIGVILPSFFIILLLAGVIQQFKELQYVNYAFVGVRAGVAVLILNAVLKLSKQCPKNIFTLLVAAVAFVLVAFFSANVILVIVFAAIAGVVVQLWLHGKGGAAQ